MASQPQSADIAGEAPAPRIVFCISGQIRDEHVSFPRIAAQAAALNATVIVSTWRRRGTKSAGIINRDQAERMFGHIVAECLPNALLGNRTFERSFPGFEAALSQTYTDVETRHILDHFPNAIIDIEDEVMHLGFADPATADKNSLRMLYKAWRCNEIKRAIERDQGAAFDAVVRLRPDTIPRLDATVLHEIRSESFSRSIHVPHYREGHHYIDDVMALSSSPVADQVAALFGRAVLSWQTGWDLIHIELWKHLQALGLEICPIEIDNWIAGDFDQHRQRNQELLLEMMQAGQVDASRFARATTWSAVRQLVAVAVDVTAQAPSQTVQAGLLRLDLTQEDLEHVCRAALLQMRSCSAEGQAEQRYLAGVLCLVCQQAEEGRLLDPRAVPELIRQVTETALSLGVPDPFSSRSLAQATAHLKDDPVSRHLESAVRHFLTSAQLKSALAGLAGAAPVDPDQYLRAGWDHLGSGRGDLAKPIASFLIARHPADWRGPDLLGHCLSRDNKLDEAVMCARQADSMVPHHGGLATRLGTLLLEQGKLEEAQPHLLRGSALWPHWISFHALARSHVAQGHFGEAKLALVEARRCLFRDEGVETNADIEQLAAQLQDSFKKDVLF